MTEISNILSEESILSKLKLLNSKELGLVLELHIDEYRAIFDYLINKEIIVSSNILENFIIYAESYYKLIEKYFIFLIDSQYKDIDYLFEKCCYYKYLNILNHIYNNNINVNWMHYLDNRSSYIDSDFQTLTMKLLIGGVKFTEIHLAFAIKCKAPIAIIKLMLETASFNLNYKNGIILKYAIKIEASLDIINLLLEYNISVSSTHQINNEYYNQITHIVDSNTLVNILTSNIEYKTIGDIFEIL